MAEIKPKLRVDVNHNPTKKGIKVQFVLPQTLEGDKKAEATQKLQSKLNQGLEQYNLTVSQDTDVPYSNVIGFLIPIADIKLLIKNAIGGGSSEPAPEEAPAPEEPMKEAEGENEKFYAVIDIYDNPRSLKANSKEEMLSMLNKTYKESTGEEYIPYSISDLEDDIYMGKKLDHVISDDWASVTKNKNVFEKDLELAQQHHSSRGIKRMQELAGVKK